MKPIIIIIILLSLFSCRKSFDDPENCILERNTLYLEDDPEGTAYYKIDKIIDDKIYISIWKPATKKWFDLRDRPEDFFTDSKFFKYTASVCPDYERSSTLRDRIKTIHLFKRSGDMPAPEFKLSAPKKKRRR